PYAACVPTLGRPPDPRHPARPLLIATSSRRCPAMGLLAAIVAWRSGRAYEVPPPRPDRTAARSRLPPRAAAVHQEPLARDTLAGLVRALAAPVPWCLIAES